MRTKFLSRDISVENKKVLDTSNILDYVHKSEHYNDDECHNFYQRKNKALLALIYYTMENELTDKQKECIYYNKFQNLKVKDIACMLKINPSTVSRHISNAQKVFDRVYEYYKCLEPLLIND